MKWNKSLGAALLGLMLTAPAWAHHAAEGIISDEIWQMIDDNLTIVDSPHLTIDFDDVMGSMRVGENPDDGSLFLLSSITVRVEDVPDYLALVENTMNEILEYPGIPGGVIGNGNSHTFDWFLVDLGDGFVEIVLQEPIGGFNSQPSLDPALALGLMRETQTRTQTQTQTETHPQAQPQTQTQTQSQTGTQTQIQPQPQPKARQDG